jgi:hypothetical protein
MAASLMLMATAATTAVSFPDGDEGQSQTVDRTQRRRIGAWVIAGASCVASCAFAQKTLEHWEQSRLLDARSQDLSRSYRDRISLHEQAMVEWEAGNRNRNLTGVTAAATVTASVLLFHLYDDDMGASDAENRAQSRAGRVAWDIDGSVDGRIRLGWSLRF